MNKRPSEREKQIKNLSAVGPKGEGTDTGLKAVPDQALILGSKESSRRDDRGEKETSERKRK